MLKRFVGTRSLDVSDIPAYMNDLDYLRILFGKKQAGEKEATNSRACLSTATL